MRLTPTTLAALFCAAALPACAQSLDGFPVARVTIYPGDTITEKMIDERDGVVPPDAEALYVRSRAALLGKVARRTLLPGQPFSQIAVENPRVVAVGAQVKIVFAEGGLRIVAYGVAQQAGAVGDVIRVRNQDSGLSISGRVQNDGSVRVGES